jgi:transcriptional regulator with XRE-family HTH domain
LADFQREREALGVRLRELRKRTNLTGVELAERLDWAQSKVSRIEGGKQTASEQDIVSWIEAVGAPADLADELLGVLRSIQADYVTWRRDLRIGVQAKQRSFLLLERRTTSIRGFETCVMPGLLQTPDYARHRIAEMPSLHSAPDDVQGALAIRMQRQQVIYDLDKQFHFILTETVLRNLLCPADAMRGQLDRLLVLSALDNMRVGVLPFAARLPLAPLNGFWLFDDSLVSVETIGAEIHLRDPEEIALYVEAFNRLQAAASYGAEARDIITRALEAL